MNLHIHIYNIDTDRDFVSKLKVLEYIPWIVLFHSAEPCFIDL